MTSENSSWFWWFLIILLAGYERWLKQFPYWCQGETSERWGFFFCSSFCLRWKEWDGWEQKLGCRKVCLVRDCVRGSEHHCSGSSGVRKEKVKLLIKLVMLWKCASWWWTLRHIARPSKQLDAVMPVEGKVYGSRASGVLSTLGILPGMGSKRLWCRAFWCLLVSWDKVSMKEPCRKPIPPSSSSDKASSAVVGVCSLVT